MAAEDFIILNISGHEQLWCRSAPRALREERGMRLRMESGRPIAPLVCARLRLVSTSWVEFGYRLCAAHTLRTYNDALGDVRHVPRIDCGCDTRESLVRHGICSVLFLNSGRSRHRGASGHTVVPGSGSRHARRRERDVGSGSWSGTARAGRRPQRVGGYKNEHKSRRCVS